MTRMEVRRKLAEAKIRLTEIQITLSEFRGRDRVERKKQLVAALKEVAQLKIACQEADDLEHRGYLASKVGIEEPAISPSRESGDSLLLEALGLFVDHGIEHKVVDRIREYFKAIPKAEEEPAFDLARELDFSLPPLPAPDPTPVAKRPPMPLLPKDPSPIRYLDADHRAASGPGTVLYKRRASR